MNYSCIHGTDMVIEAYEDIKESIRTLKNSCTTVGSITIRNELLVLHDIITGEDHSKWYQCVDE